MVISNAVFGIRKPVKVLNSLRFLHQINRAIMGEGEGFIGPSQREEIEKGRDREKQRKKKARDLRTEREIKNRDMAGRKERETEYESE